MGGALTCADGIAGSLEQPQVVSSGHQLQLLVQMFFELISLFCEGNKAVPAHGQQSDKQIGDWRGRCSTCEWSIDKKLEYFLKPWVGLWMKQSPNKKPRQQNEPTKWYKIL